MPECLHISFCFGRWNVPEIRVEAAIVWTAASMSLPVPQRKDVTFTKFHSISPKDACQKFAFLECCGDPSGLPTYPTQLAPEPAAKPTLLLVVPAVWVKEAVLSSPRLVSRTACRINSCNSSKESVGRGSGMRSQEWGEGRMALLALVSAHLAWSIHQPGLIHRNLPEPCASRNACKVDASSC